MPSNPLSSNTLNLLLLIRRVYSLFRASLAGFVWIEELLWFPQRPSRWLCWHNCLFSSSVVRSRQLNFEKKLGRTRYLSADGDDKLAIVFIQLNGHFSACGFLCNGSLMTFYSVRSFIISETSSFALLIGRTMFFHGDLFFSCSWLARFKISARFSHFVFRG